MDDCGSMPSFSHIQAFLTWEASKYRIFAFVKGFEIWTSHFCHFRFSRPSAMRSKSE